MRKLFAGLVALAVLPLASLEARAAGFIGAGWGRTELQAEVADRGFDESDVGWKVMGGFGPKYFGLEAFYVDFGRFSDSGGGVSLDADVTGWDASIFGRVPIKKFEIFAKVGLVYWDAEANLSTSGRRDDSGIDLSWGVGIGWTFGEHLGIRLEYESFEVEPDFTTFDDLSMLSVGIKFEF